MENTYCPECEISVKDVQLDELAAQLEKAESELLNSEPDPKLVWPYVTDALDIFNRIIEDGQPTSA